MTESLNLNHHKEDLNKKQTEAVTLSEESALVLAGAGSGKTKVLTSRFAWLIQNQISSPGGILAVTLKFIVLERNWNLGLGDKGIIFGSKYDTKLIIWKDIATYDVDKNNNQIIITCKPNQPIKTIKLQVGKQLKNSISILEQAISK